MKATFPAPEPKNVWNHFLDLVAIPRPSKQEGAAVDFIEAWGTKLGFLCKRDRANNICVHVPATVKNARAPIIFQCHLDIVSVTDDRDGLGADASLGKIPLERGDLDPKNLKKLIPNSKGDWINAPYTTLGADNGIGVAMMMALAEEPTRHIPLELLFTIDEEAGMTGAFGLEPEKLGLSGTEMINIDTEDDDEITVGAAGGRDVETRWSGKWEPLPQNEGKDSWRTLQITLSGLKGGHSGIEINQGRGNAIRLLGRMLGSLSLAKGLHLIDWKGGSRRNAIPDLCAATIAVHKDEVDSLKVRLRELVASFDRLYANRDTPIQLEIKERTDADQKGLTTSATRAFLLLLQAIPTGICEMTPELSGLVESSCNLAIVELSEGQAKIVCSVRGTTQEALQDVSDSVVAAAELAGGTSTVADGYPGWKPDLQSKLLKSAESCYEEMFGSKPKVHAVHAGLECGLLAEKLPGLSAVSIGPNIKGNHAVGERVSISSVAKSYQFVKGILQSLS